jgi:hypothetical protein
MLAADFDSRLPSLAAAFQRRDPFRHAVIDDFFDADTAARLLAQFPPFDRGNARNEDGDIGNKSTVERIRELGPVYAALDDLMQSPAFLERMSQLTGIAGLRYDPWYFGGGTHENRNGQDLDAHVDFNRHPVEPWHRRLNLIVYLNPDWQDDWGGLLELHSDPRSPEDRITRIAPLFNRGVVFETTEWSWHGFERIAVPPARSDITRRSIALYFYTTERPEEELAPTHSTIYVERPLPQRFRAGLTLDAIDADELRSLIERRDRHNQRLYREIADLTQRNEQLLQTLRMSFLGRLRHYAQRLLTRRAR